MPNDSNMDYPIFADSLTSTVGQTIILLILCRISVTGQVLR